MSIYLLYGELSWSATSAANQASMGSWSAAPAASAASSSWAEPPAQHAYYAAPAASASAAPSPSPAQPSLAPWSLPPQTLPLAAKAVGAPAGLVEPPSSMAGVAPPESSAEASARRVKSGQLEPSQAADSLAAAVLNQADAPLDR